jgi:hypothetical protein
MATQSGAVFDHSFKAAADQSTKQYYFVELSAADTVAVCNAAADRAIGVLMNKPAAAGQAADVRILGIAPVVSDGSGTNIAVGDYVGPSSAGKAVKKATADYSVAGIALDASTADGVVIRVLLLPGAFFRTAGG